MSYIVKQEVKGRIYAYEVKSYWDSEKKQARQKRRYLGVWDEEAGTIIPKTSQRDVKTTKIYGSPYLLNKICKELALRKKLNESLGEDGDVVLALSMTKVLRQPSLKNIHHIMEDTFIPEMYGLDKKFSSQWLSRFLERLSSMEEGIGLFYSSLIKDCDRESLVYDITSLSSYSTMMEWLEYGYNRDGLDLPQVNLGLVLSVQRQIPIYYKLFPGSVNDVITLKNLVAEVKAFGIKSCLFILDRGFYSESNIVELYRERIDFIIPLPFNTGIARRIISETNRDIDNPLYAKRYNGNIYYVHEDEITIGETEVYAYILYDKKREGTETTSFFNRLMDIETKLDGKRIYGNATEVMDRVAGNFKRYFKYTVNESIISVKRRRKAITQTVNRFGKTILLSSTKKEWDEVLSFYRERSIIEKEYVQLKNDLDAMPLRVRKLTTLKGLLFILFIALIIRSLLLQRARKVGLLKKNSIEDILLEMSKLRAVSIGGTWRLTEITKNQRTILDKMNLSIPIDPET
jgi:transposase